MWVVEHRHQLPGEAVEPWSLEILKTWLDTALGYLLSLTLLERAGWSRWSPEIPPNLLHGSVILRLSGKKVWAN